MFAWNMIEQLVINFLCLIHRCENISWPVRPTASDQYSEISPVCVVTEATCGWKHSQMWWSNSSCLYLTLCCFLSVSLHQVDVSLRVVQRPRARPRARQRARQEVRQKYEFSTNILKFRSGTDGDSDSHRSVSCWCSVINLSCQDERTFIVNKRAWVCVLTLNTLPSCFSATHLDYSWITANINIYKLSWSNEQQCWHKCVKSVSSEVFFAAFFDLVVDMNVNISHI